MYGKAKSFQSLAEVSVRIRITFFEWDRLARHTVAGAEPANNQPSYIRDMLLLLDRRILWVDGGGHAYVYSSSGGPNSAWVPRIVSTSSNIGRGKTYRITGYNFNGFSQGAAYGDDVQAAANYPLVR
jgi:hypothetical protein